MFFSSTIVSALSLTLFSAVIRAAPASCCTNDFEFTPEHREKMMTNYMGIWNGDFSLLNSTLTDKIHFEMDRHPVATGSEPTLATTSGEFLGLVMWSHQGWQSVNFAPTVWLGDKNVIALRWEYTAYMGANFTKVNTYVNPPLQATYQLDRGIDTVVEERLTARSTLKPGDEVKYSGTDVLTLDKCTGKINSIMIAQDLLNFFFKLGVTVLPL